MVGKIERQCKGGQQEQTTNARDEGEQQQTFILFENLPAGGHHRPGAGDFLHKRVLLKLQ